MNQPSFSGAEKGRVASLHLHPVAPGEPLHSVDSLELVEMQGVRGDHRYFGRKSRETGQPTQRQVSLIEREQIAEHALALGWSSVAPGAVRSNIETTGLDLIALLGREVRIGQVILFFAAPRDPCAKMDALCQGLRERMMNRRQGVLAQVRRSGKVSVGDYIYPV